MVSSASPNQLTAAQALAWLAFRDTSKGDFVDIGDTVPAAVEIPSIPPKRSKAERRLDALSRAPRLRKEERHSAYLGAQVRRVQRLQGGSRFLIDPTTGVPAIAIRQRRSSPGTLLALTTAYAVADDAARFLEPREAATELLAACAASQLSVTGLAFGAGDRVTIEAAWWTDARLCAGEAPYTLLARGAGGSTIWHDLLFDRAAVERLWPAPAVTVPLAPPPARKGRRGPKSRYMPSLIAKLRFVKQSRPDLFYAATPYELARDIRHFWQQSVPLPSSRSQLESAIEKARETILADDAAGVSPQFPSTTSAIVSH
jgi:hypothetical protein